MTFFLWCVYLVRWYVIERASYRRHFLLSGRRCESASFLYLGPKCMAAISTNWLLFTEGWSLKLSFEVKKNHPTPQKEFTFRAYYTCTFFAKHILPIGSCVAVLKCNFLNIECGFFNQVTNELLSNTCFCCTLITNCSYGGSSELW